MLKPLGRAKVASSDIPCMSPVGHCLGVFMGRCLLLSFNKTRLSAVLGTARPRWCLRDSQTLSGSCCLCAAASLWPRRDLLAGKAAPV